MLPRHTRGNRPVPGPCRNGPRLCRSGSFSYLPRRMLLEKAHDRRIPESTALTWLKRLTKQGALVSVDGKGTYHKN